MIGFAPLIAAGDAVGIIITVIVLFFIFLFKAVSQMAKQGEQGPGQPPRRLNPQQPRANVPQPPPARQPAPGQRAGGVADEINSFLNRLTQQQPVAQRQPPVQQRPAPQRPVRRLPPAASQPVEAKVIVLPDTESVGGHVRNHLGTRGLGQRLPTHLEGQAAQADDEMEAHRHDVFDHGVGSLARGEDAAAELQVQGDPAGAIPATAAVGLAAMFANPGNIRQAIIMQEVLNRPTDRWG